MAENQNSCLFSDDESEGYYSAFSQSEVSQKSSLSSISSVGTQTTRFSEDSSRQSVISLSSDETEEGFGALNVLDLSAFRSLSLGSNESKGVSEDASKRRAASLDRSGSTKYESCDSRWTDITETSHSQWCSTDLSSTAGQSLNCLDQSVYCNLSMTSSVLDSDSEISIWVNPRFNPSPSFRSEDCVYVSQMEIDSTESSPKVSINDRESDPLDSTEGDVPNIK